jgi:adenylate kinase family enzyme
MQGKARLFDDCEVECRPASSLRPPEVGRVVRAAALILTRCGPLNGCDQGWRPYTVRVAYRSVADTLRSVDRIAIVGCGGSGKSTLARSLGRALDLPVTHLDAVYYDADWNPLSHDEFAAYQRRLVASGRWLIDGNYASTLPIRLAAADTVIFLDRPAYACLWGIFRRHRFGPHVETGADHRITWDFIRYVIGYRRTMRPRVSAAIAEHAPDARLIVVTNKRQARRVAATFAAR